MIQKMSEEVSVSLIYDHRKHQALPEQINWRGRVYAVDKLGLHHSFRTGRVLFHVFSVLSGELFLRLVLNTENLHWQLEEINDGVI